MRAVLVLVLAAGDLDRARTQYSEMKYDAALKSLAKAITSPGLTPEDRAAIYLYTGLCRHQQGDEKGARAAFREALTLDRDIELPEATSPKARVTFERARAELPPLPLPKQEPAPVAEPPPPIVIIEPAPTPVPAPAPVPVVTEEPAPKTKRWWPTVVTLSLGAASLGAGLAVGNVASSTRTRADTEPFGSDGDALARQAQTQATIANVLFGVAGALALFGLIAAFVF